MFLKTKCYQTFGNKCSRLSIIVLGEMCDIITKGTYSSVKPLAFPFSILYFFSDWNGSLSGYFPLFRNIFSKSAGSNKWYSTTPGSISSRAMLPYLSCFFVNASTGLSKSYSPTKIQAAKWANFVASISLMQGSKFRRARKVCAFIIKGITWFLEVLMDKQCTSLCSLSDCLGRTFLLYNLWLIIF